MRLRDGCRTSKNLIRRLLALQGLLTLTVLSPLSCRGQAVIGGCPVFPANNVWNRPIDGLPVDSHSADYLATMGSDLRLHIDPSIPFNVVGPEVKPKSLVRLAYPAESDTGPMPIPDNPRLEKGGDAHMLVLQTGTCRLYELFLAKKQDDGWSAASAAFFDLRSNRLRPDGWTSSDAAGLPILPGIVAL